METSELLSVAVCLLVFFLLQRFFGNRNKPPGPLGLPILGYVPFLSKHPYLDLQKLAKKYGNVFSVRMGSQYVVVLNDYDSTKEAFAQDVYLGRPPFLPFDFNKETDETLAIKGLPWKEHRRASISILRNLGLGKSKMQDLMQEEITALLEQLKRNMGKPFLLRDILSSSMSNNMAAFMFGKRFEYNDPVRKMLNEAIMETAKGLQQVGWYVFFPWLKVILNLFGIGDRSKVSSRTQELKMYSQKEMDEHKKTLNVNDIRDYIDGYLLEMQKHKDNPSFVEPVVQDLVTAFFIAGSETVRLNLEWSVLMAAAYPDAQRRIQAEIDEVVGRIRLPSVTDIKSMPFTQAFTMEILRFRPVIPLNILRYTLADSKLNGYFIPKSSYILSNLWAILHNPEYWGNDAEEFRPERFLTEDGKDVKKQDHFIPFCIGKRACPGESMAKSELFLYLVSILQHLNVRFPEGHVERFEATLGVGLQPTTDKYIFTKRI